MSESKMSFYIEERETLQEPTIFWYQNFLNWLIGVGKILYWKNDIFDFFYCFFISNIFFFIPKIRCTFFLQLNSLSALIQPLEFELKYFLLIENNLKEIVIQYWTRTLLLQFLHTCMWRKEIPSTSVTTIRTQFCRHCIR